MPDPYPTVFVESYKGIIDGEGSEVGIEFVEADEGLAEYVDALVVGEVASVNEAEGNVL